MRLGLGVHCFRQYPRLTRACRWRVRSTRIVFGKVLSGLKIGFEDIFAAYERLEKPPSQYAHGPPRAALFAVRRFLTSRDKSTMDEKICEANGGHAFLRFAVKLSSKSPISLIDRSTWSCKERKSANERRYRQTKGAQHNVLCYIRLLKCTF